MNTEAQKCPECGSTDIRWSVGARIGSSGRETPIFFTGCQYCSETFSVISLEDAADLLTNYSKEKILV